MPKTVWWSSDKRWSKFASAGQTVTTASLGTTGFPQGSCLSPSNTYRSGGGRGASAATGGKPSDVMHQAGGGV
ncbi:hypothetical protein OEZ85_002421 [Tetradesmus obliquus]|uniref:Uncharacterized protein n=1 Tax=Tetradesmus obliquus TaxID=3088 RepID=A0ABY8U002_TETOB|nr:hypothetical protein OEZ85_002421 [Tetradesmus obliquus]